MPVAPSAVILALVLLAPAACRREGPSPPPGTDTGPGPDAASDARIDQGSPETATDLVRPAGGPTLVTFNAGLARNFVPYAEERLPHVLDAVAGLDADVVCLQEVWEDGDVEALLEAAGETFPHAHRVRTEEEPRGPAACTEAETAPLLACVQEHCADTEDLTGCVMANCATEFGGISPGCTTCLAAHIAEPVEDIIAACLSGSSTMLFGGRNGLLLLSRTPLLAPDHLVLDSFFTQRAVLAAGVETPAGTLQVFCTHLNAALSEVTYRGPFASWEEEQAAQAAAVLAWMETRAGEAPRALLGDMNCGPDLPPEIAGEFPETFASLTAAGLESPYLALFSPPCTWCGDNPLTGGGDSHVIDHVLLGGTAAAGATAKRILDGTVVILTGDGPAQLPLSDHFGVGVTLAWGASR
ncbi:MAG: endonuclease/exonuclease/phosphatase family protein [Deltaproteobacteria bacterium]|nr:endonuclease/exonuclease/phosphatase family protein [Deltaproteobacteria bacterium]